MIYKITQKEYKQIASLQKNGFHQCLLFSMKDGTKYKCDTMGAAGLKEIIRFRSAKRSIEKDQLNLLGMPISDTL